MRMSDNADYECSIEPFEDEDEVFNWKVHNNIISLVMNPLNCIMQMLVCIELYIHYDYNNQWMILSLHKFSWTFEINGFLRMIKDNKITKNRYHWMYCLLNGSDSFYISLSLSSLRFYRRRQRQHTCRVYVIVVYQASTHQVSEKA